jgi:hypothetical protein
LSLVSCHLQSKESNSLFGKLQTIGKIQQTDWFRMVPEQRMVSFAFNDRDKQEKQKKNIIS